MPRWFLGRAYHPGFQN